MARESVLVGVCGGVVGLTAGAGDAGDGGEEDEEVEGGREMGVEVPGALDFGFCGGGKGGGGKVVEDAVLSRVGSVGWMFVTKRKGTDLEDHGGLDTAFDWEHVERVVFQDGRDCFRIADVAGRCCDVDSTKLHFLNQFHSGLAFGTRSGQEDEVLRFSIDHPAHNTAPKSTETSRYNICRVRLKRVCALLAWYNLMVPKY